MKELQFTLYEVFGYLLPGAVFCGGLGVMYWALFFTTPAVEFDLKTVEVWASFLVFSYVGGHVAQAIGNKVARQFQSAEEKLVTNPKAFPASLVAACRDKVREVLKADAAPTAAVPGEGEPPAELPPQWLYRFCDDAVLRSGKLGEREVYVYREGFYRGTFIGFVVLTLALVGFAARLWLGTDDHKARLGVIEFTGWQVVFFAVIDGVAAWYLWNRYWRFAEYRVSQALIGFLTIKDKLSEKKPAEEKKDNPK